MILIHKGVPCSAQRSVQLPGYHWVAQGAAFQPTKIFNYFKNIQTHILHSRLIKHFKKIKYRAGREGRKLQSHSNQGLGSHFWMRMVQGSSACPDSRLGFEPFSTSFQVSPTSLLKLSSHPFFWPYAGAETHLPLKSVISGIFLWHVSI